MPVESNCYTQLLQPEMYSGITTVNTHVMTTQLRNRYCQDFRTPLLFLPVHYSLPPSKKKPLFIINYFFVFLYNLVLPVLLKTLNIRNHSVCIFYIWLLLSNIVFVRFSHVACSYSLFISIAI